MTSYTVVKDTEFQKSEEKEEFILKIKDAGMQGCFLFQRSDILIQTLIITTTIYVAFENESLNSFDLSLLRSLGPIFIVLGIFSIFTNGFVETFDKKNLNFDFIYLFYLSFMISLIYYNHDSSYGSMAYIQTNMILTVNIFKYNEFLKLFIQFLLFQHTNSNVNNLWVFFGASIINSIASKILAHVGDLKSLDIIDCNIFSLLLTNLLYLNRIEENSSIPFAVFSRCLLSFLIVVFLNYLIDGKLIPFNKPYLRSFVCLSNIFILLPLLIKTLLTIDGQDPVKWLLNFILSSNTRMFIMSIWLTTVAILVPSVVSIKHKISLNTSRKVWHFLIIFLIIYPFKLEQLLVKIALSGSIVLFLIVEYIRYMKFEPIGDYLDSQLRAFADHRDTNGTLIISYIYLIIGVSTPLLIVNSPAGLVSLGVGDALASIVGGRWGRLKWSNTNKTVEGTLAFIISTSITCFLLKNHLGYYEDIRYIYLFYICVLSGILEGNSTLNDNILIPSFMLISEAIFKHF